MSDASVDALIRDLLEWLSSGERTYEEVIEAWRTSCPKLPVWEEATDRGLLLIRSASGRRVVHLSPAGISWLQQQRAIAKSTK